MTEVLRDLVFAERTGFRPLTLDLHLPDGRGPSPVVLFVHGGGWRLGSRRVFVPHREEAATFGRVLAAGFAVAAIDYRLSGEARFPAQLDDLRAAVEWLGEHGPEHGVDGGRVVAWGESAGAHLAAFSGLDRTSPVAGVVGWYGAYDLTALGRDLFPDDPGRFDHDAGTREAGLIGGAVAALPDAARAASPARQALGDAAPFLLVHGEDDDLVPFAQSARFAAALAAAGASVELVPVPGASHFWRGVDDLERLFAVSLDFASRVTR